MVQKCVLAVSERADICSAKLYTTLWAGHTSLYNTRFNVLLTCFSTSLPSLPVPSSHEDFSPGF